MQKIKVGIIGTGFIGPAHVEALRRLGFVDIVALADINEEVAKQKAELLNIEKYYGDYKSLLNDKEIEVVHVCTPNHLHYKISKEALLAGKHVVCEKPLAMNSFEGAELIKIAKEKKLVNAVNFNLRFYPLMHHARKIIESGELGKIFAVNGSYQQDWLFYETDFNWRLQPEFSGDSRAVADIGSHWLDLIEFVTSINVSSVCADFATFHSVRKKPLKPVETYSGKILSPEDYEDIEINTEDYATVLLRFNNGAHGSMTVNQVAAGRKNRLYFEIYGSKKAIGWNSERPNELWIGKRDGNNEVLVKDPSLLSPYAREIVSYPGGHNEGFPDTLKQMFAKFYKYIIRKGHIKGEPPEFPTFEDGYRELLLCEAIVKSAKSNKWIEIE
ncbi:Gfo/Idh/MocA family protein [Caldanaerobius polysaccharolyticus]|uniref:Gfo/Idh/MocA family protein n=1 Tax=Caldanaerobius polysaccharolyticus TaxID=44256 RepID=UPI00047CA88B|nr:Gfo/Idh/MocA family oxidoreductase [Caldanaerobius polysaccharolyticus]